jgi:hypothetical protein
VRNDIIPYRNGRFYFTAGKTERIGLEVSGRVDFAMGLSANIAVTASSNKYKEYTVDSVHYNPSLAGKAADYGGNEVVGIPNLYVTVGMKYQPVALGGLYVRASMQNIGKYYVNDANTIEVPGSTIFNLGAGIEHLAFAKGRFYAGAFVGINNVADTKYVGSAWLNPDIVNGVPVYIESGLPRNLVGSVWVGMNL